MRPALRGCTGLAVLVSLAVSAGAPARLHGREPAAPRRVWSHAIEARGSPVADETTAYFLSRGHEVVAVDIASGDIRWRRQTFESGDIFSGASLVLGERSLVVGDYNLLAFDTAGGRLLWRFIPADGDAPGIYMGDAVAGAVLAGSPSGRVYTVDAESGALRWSSPIGLDVPTTVYAPAAQGDSVAVTFTEFPPHGPTRGGVAMLAANDGRVIWRRTFADHLAGLLGTNAAGGPLFRDDEVLASGGDGQIVAFDRMSGEVRWVLPPVAPAVRGPIAWERDYRALALAGEVLVSGSLTGEIVGIDLRTRQERWRYTARGLGSSAFRIGVVDGIVYVPFFNGQLVALDARSGEERWRVGEYTSGFLWPPAVRRGLVFLAGSGAGMMAVTDRP